MFLQRALLYIFVCGMSPLSVTAQDAVADNGILQALLTEVAAMSSADNDVDTELLYEVLEDLAENPIHVNDTDFEDLSRIFWLTEFQVKSLLEYVQNRSPILSHYEIAMLTGFTPELTQTLIPFISLERKPDVGTEISPVRAIRYGKNKIITSTQRVLEDREGYIRPDSVTNRYAGNPLKANLRYTFNYANQIHFGITASKNAGEAFLRKNNPLGFDFYSVHFQLNTKKRLKTLTLGDFRADYGQGLVLWSRINYSKTAMTLNSMRYHSGLRKYGSLDKNRFMRGAGATLRFNHTDVSIFYSRKAIDATVTARDENGKATEVSSFPTDGYHRTPTEIAKKRAVTEQITGTNISVNRTDWHIGATAIHYGYDAMVIPNRYIYSHYGFSGKSNSNYSIDFRFRMGDAIFYGEHALARNGAWALLYGAQLLIDERLTVNMLYRRYDRDYHAHYGMALGENSPNSNEEGFFIGWNFNVGGLWRFSSYYDIFRFPWLRYGADAPSYGKDALFQVDCTPSSDTKIYIQARYREKEENAKRTTLNTIIPAKTASAKIVFSHRFSEGSGTGNHLEIKNFRKENTSSSGYFLAQDIYTTINTFRRHPLRITLRYAVFDTDSYDARIYTFENDMLYTFNIPAFYDQGSRLYALMKYKIGTHLNLSFKYATTHYTNRTDIGSGLNRIRGSRSSEIKAQIVYSI